jgi:hypothetical protein
MKDKRIKIKFVMIVLLAWIFAHTLVYLVLLKIKILLH